jgi:hypothetical protein
VPRQLTTYIDIILTGYPDWCLYSLALVTGKLLLPHCDNPERP